MGRYTDAVKNHFEEGGRKSANVIIRPTDLPGGRVFKIGKWKIHKTFFSEITTYNKEQGTVTLNSQGRAPHYLFEHACGEEGILNTVMDQVTWSSKLENHVCPTCRTSFPAPYYVEAFKYFNNG